MARQLESYPLYPYLRYAELLKDIKHTSAKQVADFLERYQDTPLASRFRRKWLSHLAKNERWREFQRFYDPQFGTLMRCHYSNSLLRTGQRAKALELVKTLWLQGRSQPSACDPVFDAWHKAGKLTGTLVWQRIALAMDANHPGLAKYLGRYLNKSDATWLKRWLKLHSNPKYALNDKAFKKSHPYRTTMLAHAVERLARRDELQALQTWRQLQPKYRFDPDQTYDVQRRIALYLMRSDDAAAYRFLSKLQPRAEDARLHEARLQAALYRQDWPSLLNWLNALPAEMRAEERWLYWQGRALEATGKQAQAKALFGEVAQNRSYYGFLAADRIAAEYHLEHVQTPVAPDKIERIGTLAGVQRARELRALARWVDARREWRDATAKLDTQDLMAAAVLAESWGWHDQAIFTLAKTQYWDDLELRFPIRHRDAVTHNATRHQLDEAWVFAVVRQESAFMEDARSGAGARGLMQLMPATARLVARKDLARKPPRLRELYEPKTNIGLGTAYLRRVLNRLDDHAVLATAAYNAGPHRVERWLPDDALASDIWVEVVPFRETRGYLRRVMAYTTIYEKRLGLDATRISDRMRPVQNKQKLTAGHTSQDDSNAG